jgi:hypothetical protein
MKNKVLVDTDILSYIFKQKNPLLIANYEAYIMEHKLLHIKLQ